MRINSNIEITVLCAFPFYEQARGICPDLTAGGIHIPRLVAPYPWGETEREGGGRPDVSSSTSTAAQPPLPGSDVPGWPRLKRNIPRHSSVLCFQPQSAHT